MTEAGIDVSKWQGSIDWAEAKTQIGFSMVKATQGVAEIDPDYAANIAALREVNEHRGSYHYPDAGDPIAEADFYVNHAGRLNGEMQALDFEGAVLDHNDPVGWAEQFLQHVIDRTRNRPLIYMSGDTVTRFDWSRVIRLNVGLWCASWSSAPERGQWPFVIMWQRDDTGHLAGINGDVDQDVFYGDDQVWAEYANNIDTPAPEPAPAPRPSPVPAPRPVPAPPPQPAGLYVVKAGDSLSHIGAEFGVSVAELVAANEHRYPSLGWNPNLIQIGWQLAIPGHTAPAPAQPLEHTVQPGDTLSGLAAAHNASVQQLVAWNDGRYPSLASNPDLIEAGWTLRVQ